jgi:UDP-3-O-[3-hydroxymyristoyl] glucosamine N-acyltransferase
MEREDSTQLLTEVSYMEWDIESLLSILGVDYRSEGARRKIKGVSSIKEASENELSFCYYDGEKGVSLLSKSNAGIILCKKSMGEVVHPKAGEQQFIFVDNPRLVFVQVVKEICEKKKVIGISERAVISEKAKIGSNCYIGDYVVIGDNCRIGNNTIIYDRVSLVQNCHIGNDCVIQPGVTIGADGFAFERYPSGELVRFPHVRGVKIGDNVEICANTNIARGSLSDTIIGDGTKVDAMVQIAHNVVIGKNCEITTGTIIGGSTKIGDMSWTGLNSTLKDNIKIGTNVLVAAGAVVIHDVQDQDVVAGVPAKSIKDKVTSDLLFLMAGQESKKQSPAT